MGSGRGDGHTPGPAGKGDPGQPGGDVAVAAARLGGRSMSPPGDTSRQAGDSPRTPGPGWGGGSQALPGLASRPFSPPPPQPAVNPSPPKPHWWLVPCHQSWGGGGLGHPPHCPCPCRCTPGAILRLLGGAPGGAAGRPALHRRQLPTLRHRPAPGSRPRTPGLHVGPGRAALHRPGGPQLPAGGDGGAGAAGHGALHLLGQQQLRHRVLVPAPGRGR